MAGIIGGNVYRKEPGRADDVEPSPPPRGAPDSGAVPLPLATDLATDPPRGGGGLPSLPPGSTLLPVFFRDIFTRECAFVWNTLRRLGVAPGDLEDLVHDVFLTVHLRLGDYDRTRPIRPWLFGIAYRVAARYRDLARNRYETLRPPPSESADPAPRADEEIARREAQEVLAGALEELELGQRAVFLMHDLEGFSMPEIAAALALPLNTAYSRLRLAREHLKAVLTRTKKRRGKGS